jgi:hypothetical protein
MTYEEALEKFGNVPLSFSSYYKFVFYYGGSFEGYSILAGYGGNSTDIYRHEVAADSKETICALSPSYITISDDTGVIFNWSD